MKAKTFYLITGFVCVSSFQTMDIIFNQYLPLIGFVPFWFFNILYLFLDIAFFIKVYKSNRNKYRSYKLRQSLFREVLQFA